MEITLFNLQAPRRIGHAVQPVLPKIQFSGAKPSGDSFQVKRAGLDKQIQNFIRWAESKAAQLPAQSEETPEVFIPPLVAVSRPNAQRQRENRNTLQLYKQTFPTFLWTGIECSNPETKQGERWDELTFTDFYNPATRRKQIETMLNLGIQNVRLGIPNHKIDKQRSWRGFSTIIRDFRKHGAKISLDLQHFGLPDRFRDVNQPEKSGYLNPKWPKHFAQFAMSAVKRHFNDVDAFTIINEPLVTNAFSGNHWNEGFPGWGHPDFDRFFIERALLIAEGATTVRFDIEKHIQSSPSPQKARKVFVHNEAVDYRTDDETSNRFKRFLTSDLILGHAWLLEGDYKQSDMYQWLEKAYVRPGHETADREKLVTQLDDLKKRHLDFEARFKKTMRADTVFGVDYYVTNEGCKTGPDQSLSHRVEDYAADVKTGKRRGLYGITVEYWNRYHLPVLHTETNMENQRSAQWGTQQLLELAQVAKSGIPVLGFNWYSLMDQFGWDKLLAGSPKEAKRNHIGLVSARDYGLRAFAAQVLPDLRKALSR